MNNKQWSEELIRLTHDTIYNMNIASFYHNNRCYLKNIDGRFGYIKLEDAMNEDYTVYIDPDEVSEQFETINDLTEAGWAVD